MGYISSLMKRYTGTKRRIDALFYLHTVVSAVLGIVGFVLPHTFEWFLVHHGERLTLRDNADPSQKVAHLLVRCYAALIAGQGAGGEAGPVHSAGLLMAGEQAWPIADLRVDWAETDPIGQLAALWALWLPQMDAYVQRGLNPTVAPSYGVPGDE